MLQRQKLETLKSSALAKHPRLVQAGLAAFLLAALATACWFGWQQYDRQSKLAEARKFLSHVRRGSVEIKISASGTIRPFNQVKLSPKYTGLVRALNVQQGDRVKRGQVVALMDDSNLLGQYRAAQGAYQATKAAYEKALHGNRQQEIADSQAQVQRAAASVRAAGMMVNRARAEVSSCKSQLLRDQTNAHRMQQLKTQGALSDQDALNSQTAAEMTAAQLERAQQDLKQAEAAHAQTQADHEGARQRFSMIKEGFRKEDIEAAQQAMIQAAGNMQYIQSQLDDTKIKAPFDGVITQKYADIGAIVAPTTASATNSATSSSILSLAGRLEMVAAVAETDIDNIRPGQQVVITASAYPSQVFHGKVNLIAPEAIVTQNVTSFEVHTSIDDDPQGRLMSGMNVNAEFLAGKKNGVLLIPTVCVVTKKAKTGVFVPAADGTPQFKQIKLGSTSDADTIVSEGLQDGDEIFIALSKEQLLQQGYTEKNILAPTGTGSGGTRQGQGSGGLKNKL